MRRSKYYNMRLPERGAREGEANDAADIEDLTYDLGIIDAEMPAPGGCADGKGKSHKAGIVAA